MVKYMIWGLMLVIRDMVRSGGFHEEAFMLHSNGHVVGLIRYGIFQHSEASRAEIGNLSTADMLQPASHSSITSVNVTSKIQYHIDEIQGPDLKLGDIAMVLMGGLNEICEPRIGRRVVGGQVIALIPPYRPHFELWPIVPPPADPPEWFTYGIAWIGIVALAEQYFWRSTSRKPVQFSMLRDGLFAAFGELTNGESRSVFEGTGGEKQNFTSS